MVLTDRPFRATIEPIEKQEGAAHYAVCTIRTLSVRPRPAGGGDLPAPLPHHLSIGAKEPAEFQEAIRKDFPQYAARQEQLPPKVVKKGNATALEPQKPITNYNFISEDGRWKLNLTQGFIALSTLSYTRWEDFATRLDRPLAQFIQLYQPAFFERIGLRYVNAVSRQRWA